MKILYVIDSLIIGGAEKLVADLIPLISLCNYSVDLLLLINTETPLRVQLEKEGINVYSLQKKGSWYNPFLIFKLIPYVKSYDLIHVHLFPASYWCVLAKWISFSRVRLVFTEHSTSNRRRKIFIFKFIDRIVYKAFAHVVCISTKTQEFLISYTKRKKNVSVIYNGIDVLKYAQSEPYSRNDLDFPISKNDFILIQIANFRVPKDQETVIRALIYLPRHVHAIFVGSGERMHICYELSVKLRVEDRVHFLGQRFDVPALLKMSDIVIMSSNYEGFGLAALEGMAAGKPTVASNVEGLSEIVKGAGVLFQPGNEKELAGIVWDLISDKNYYDKISVKCSEKAFSYDISKTVEKYIRIYDLEMTL